MTTLTFEPFHLLNQVSDDDEMHRLISQIDDEQGDVTQFLSHDDKEDLFLPELAPVTSSDNFDWFPAEDIEDPSMDLLEDDEIPEFLVDHPFAPLNEDTEGWIEPFSPEFYGLPEINSSGSSPSNDFDPSPNSSDSGLFPFFLVIMC